MIIVPTRRCEVDGPALATTHYGQRVGHDQNDSSRGRDALIGRPKNNGCLGRLSKAQGSCPGNDFTSWFPLIVEALTRLRSSVDAVSLRNNCHENLFQI